MSKPIIVKVNVLAWTLAFSSMFGPSARADDPRGSAPTGTSSHPYDPKIAPASEEARRAMRSFRVPAGLEVELFAAEPLLANPVAFCIRREGGRSTSPRPSATARG